jgi:putative Mg2+ transporter-C (MgtC) family protein
MIIRRGNHIEGLTTAAGLWMAAAIGMAVAANYYILAVLTTAFLLLLFMLNDRKLKGEEPVVSNQDDLE